MKRWFTPDYGLLLALLLPLFAVIPLLTHAGLPNTADGPAHLMRQVELNQAWQEGNFYPRWGRDLAYGHGMPIFSYAPPALYQLTQFFHLSGLPLDAAMKAVLVFDFLLYNLGMFLFARRLFGPYPALVAAALYVYAPYRLREGYIQGNYGQFTGLAFYPLIFWAFHGLLTTHRPGYLVAAAAALAGLLFSHNISFMLFAPMFGAYLLFLLIFPPEEAKTRGHEDAQSRLTSHASRLGLTLAALLLGLGLAAIFWLPAFGERHEIQLTGITRGFFDFRENFISLSEFFSPPLPLDLAAINPEFPLSLGLPQIIGATIGLVSLLLVGFFLLIKQIAKRSTPRPSPPLLPTTYYLLPSTFFAFFLLLYAFLALPQSQPLWEAVPLLELAEFPWRMLGPAIFCASLVAAGGFTIYDFALRAFGGFTINKTAISRHNSAEPNSNFLFLTSNFYLLPLFLIIAINFYYLYPSQFIVWGTPAPADAFAYEVTSGAIGTTSTGEFLPRHARQHPRPDALWPDYATGRPPQKIDPTTLPPGTAVETITQRAEADTFRVNTPQEFTATLRALYWPGWQVYLDGQPTSFTITDPTGLIQTRIPAGQHTLTLQLESTPLRTTGQWLTLLSAAILIIVSGFALKQTRKSQPISNPKGTLRSLQSPREASNLHAKRPISGHFFALTTAILIFGYLLSRPLAPFFTLQSNPDQPQPAEQTLRVDFGIDQTPLLRLVGADTPPQTAEISPGEASELTATIYWRALQKLDTNYSVFLHLDAPDGQTLATADEGHPENIPTRNWPTGLYLRNPLHLQIPPDLPPIRYELNAGLYAPQTQQRLTILPGEATTYSLGFVWLVPPQPALPRSPLAHFGPAITLWQSDFSTSSPTLTLLWQTSQPLERDDAIFIHLLDAQGHLLAQADGAPYAGLYPLAHWLPGQIITDARSLPDSTGLVSIAVGLYNPTTGDRLPATDAAGQPLPDNRLVIPVQQP